MLLKWLKRLVFINLFLTKRKGLFLSVCSPVVCFQNANATVFSSDRHLLKLIGLSVERLSYVLL